MKFGRIVVKQDVGGYPQPGVVVAVEDQRGVEDVLFLDGKIETVPKGKYEDAVDLMLSVQVRQQLMVEYIVAKLDREP